MQATKFNFDTTFDDEFLENQQIANPAASVIHTNPRKLNDPPPGRFIATPSSAASDQDVVGLNKVAKIVPQDSQLVARNGTQLRIASRFVTRIANGRGRTLSG